MNTNFCPKDCPERKVGCHADCPKYIGKSKAYKEEKAARQKHNNNRAAVSNVQYYGLCLSKKRRNNGK